MRLLFDFHELGFDRVAFDMKQAVAFGRRLIEIAPRRRAARCRREHDTVLFLDLVAVIVPRGHQFQIVSGEQAQDGVRVLDAVRLGVWVERVVREQRKG